ncbi:MAG TPA: S8 family serine peptidase [Gaiellales bacterium]|nr:S8 family serine peptidase [Gaiellales bacterium]
MTRRRLRTRTLVLSLAATLAGIAALPVHGAPDPLSAALRSWDVVIGDGRSGQALPQQVIIVLAAPPAVALDGADASKTAATTQQLDLDAIARAGIWMSINYRYVNALNAVSATVRPDQVAQLRASPEVAGVYPVRRLYPAAMVARHLAALGKDARPLEVGGGDGKGVTVALLDGPIDSSHPYLHDLTPAWNAIAGKPQTNPPDPAAAAHATEMAGIVTGRGGPAGLHGVAPSASLVPIQVLELQQGALMGTTATLLAGLDRALDPNGDGNLSDHANVILAPLAEPFAAFGGSAETVAAAGVDRVGAVLIAAAGNDGATGGRFGTIASPAASPGWLAVGASDGRSALPTVDVALGTDGIQKGVDNVPLLGALAPKSDTSIPLVLPAGPTKSDSARAPADVVAGTDEGDFRATDGTSLVSGKAVLLPRDGAPIPQRAAAAGAAGATALVLYGDGGGPAGALGLDDRVKLPIAVLPGDQGAAAAATLLTGGAVTITFSTMRSDDNPQAGSVAAFSSTGLAFDDSVKPDLVAPGVAVTTSAPAGRYLAQSGTSVAAAQVAGVAALVMQAHPTWLPMTVRGALVGTANAVGGSGDGPAAVEAQGGGTVDPAGAVAATVVAEPSSLSFGLARAATAKVSRVLTLENTSSSTVHVSVALSRDRVDDGDASVSLSGAPSSLAIGPGNTMPVPLTLQAHGLPATSTVIGGWILVSTGGGGTLRVPWALSRSDDLAAGLIGSADLVPALVQPAKDGNTATKLSLVLGSANSNGTARLEIAPVQRLSVDLYAGSRLLGRLVERHELLPGSYRYGITGIDPSTGKALAPGIYRLMIDAVSADDVTSERQLGFTVAAAG